MTYRGGRDGSAGSAVSTTARGFDSPPAPLTDQPNPEYTMLTDEQGVNAYSLIRAAAELRLSKYDSFDVTREGTRLAVEPQGSMTKVRLSTPAMQPNCRSRTNVVCAKDVPTALEMVMPTVYTHDAQVARVAAQAEVTAMRGLAATG